ncbi:MAG: TonB-dependent receptor, partial [Myxococcota bacterium]
DVTERLRVIPGLRLDAYLLDGEVRTAADPRVVGRYQLSDKWLAKGYVGLFSQAPQAEGFDSQFGNPELSLERALHTGLGGEWKPSKLWTIDGEIYFIDRYDLALYTPDPELDFELGRIIPLFSSGIGDTYGLELLIKREVSEKLYGWLSYTLSRSTVKTRPEDERRPTFFDQRHVPNLVASYTFDAGWEIGGRFRLTSGSPTTPVIGATLDADASTHNPVIGAELSDRNPTFHQLDVRVEKTWVFNYYTLGLYLDIQNVYNAANVEAVQYDYRFRESAPVTSVPFLPTLGVRGKW